MVVVFNASGRFGGAAARAFLERGVPVRAVVGDPERAADLKRRGAELYRANYRRPDSLRGAMDGATAVIHSTPWRLDSTDPMGQEKALGGAIVESAKSAGVLHYIYLSALGADSKSAVAQFRVKAEIESRIRDAGLPYTFLRANLFMDHFKRQMPEIRSGKLSGPLKSGVPISLVAIQDVAKAAWTAFREKKIGMTFELVGPRPITFTDVAEAFALALGRRVLYEPMPPREWVETAWSNLPAPLREDAAVMFGVFNQGEFIAGPLPLLNQLGIRPISIIDFALAAVR